MFPALNVMVLAGWLPTEWRRALRALASFARRHCRCFVRGVVAALMVVGLRLALPWPLRVLIDPWLSGQSVHSAGVLSWILLWIDPPVLIGGIFLLLLLSLGYADFAERLNFARFAIGLVEDLRAEAIRVVSQDNKLGQLTRSGDLIACLIGDTVRIKAGLKNFLVHVVTNGILFLGVIIVLASMHRTLGLIFASGALVAVILTSFSTSRIFRKSLKTRKKEGKLANRIQQASVEKLLEKHCGKVNRSSGFSKASVVRIQGLTTWWVHGIFGVAVMAALWVGGRAVSAGHLSGGDMFVLLAYALMLRAPMVRLARQGTRTGKIIASTDRLAQLLDDPSSVLPKQKAKELIRTSLEEVDNTALAVTGSLTSSQQRYPNHLGAEFGVFLTNDNNEK